jgi:hypothetical protein
MKYRISNFYWLYKALVANVYCLVASGLLYSQTPNSVPTTGNVGLGTNSPNCKLEVVGNSRLSGHATIDSTVVVKDSARFEKDMTIEGNVLINGDARIDHNLKVDGTVTMSLLADPAKLVTVGIQPSGILQRVTRDMLGTQLGDGLGCFPLTDMNGNVSGYAPQWSYVTGGGAPGNTAPAIIYTGTPCNANVGINTNNPVAALHVDGYAIIEDSLTVGVAGTTEPWLSVNNSGLGIRAIPQAALHVRTYGPDAVLVQAGTANIMKLNDQGTLYVRELKVTLQPFPDYVFEPNYYLMTLAELRNYIATHKHLPGMSAAKEIETSEASVNALLLKQQEKIEELTLYILELEERIKKLEVNIDSKNE